MKVVWKLVALVVAVIFFVFAMTFYLYWFSKNYDCQFNPNPWCWDDWRCNLPTGVTFPAQSLYGCGTDANGQPLYGPRDENYCNNASFPNAPGCQCVPDANGNVSANCKFGWSEATVGNCAKQLANYKDGSSPSLVNNCDPSGAGVVGQ